MNASTEKFAGINLLPWNVKSPAGRWLSSRQQAAICQASAAQPALTRHAPPQLPALRFYLFSSLREEFCPSPRSSSWRTLLAPGRGRSLCSPTVGAEALCGVSRCPGPWTRTKHAAPQKSHRQTCHVASLLTYRYLQAASFPHQQLHSTDTSFLKHHVLDREGFSNCQV